jgi:hypothetical protein
VVGPAPQGHALHRARRQRSRRPTHVVLVAEQTLHDVGKALDVPMWVHRPYGARHEPVVVEDPHRAERRVLGIDVRIERVMPAGPEPPTVHVGDLVIHADLQRHRPSRGQPTPYDRSRVHVVACGDRAAMAGQR